MPDAGEHVADLGALLRRMESDWLPSIDCGPGWYALLSRLAKRLEEVDPDRLIEIYQIKEKLGELRVYLGTGTFGCCRAAEAAWVAEHPRPEPTGPDSGPLEAWSRGRAAAMAEHRATEEHMALAAEANSRYAKIAPLVQEIRQESLETCEETGKPGVVMRSGGWLKTLDPVSAPSHYELAEFSDEAVEGQIKAAAGDSEKLEAAVRQLARRAAHQHVVIGRLLAALRAERGRH